MEPRAEQEPERMRGVELDVVQLRDYVSGLKAGCRRRAALVDDDYGYVGPRRGEARCGGLYAAEKSYRARALRSACSTRYSAM